MISTIFSIETAHKYLIKKDIHDFSIGNYTAYLHDEQYKKKQKNKNILSALRLLKIF
jgi:hypothetical protein